MRTANIKTEKADELTEQPTNPQRARGEFIPINPEGDSFSEEKHKTRGVRNVIYHNAE